MWLMRPVMANPPLCSILDVRTRLTLADVADLHELLDVQEAAAERAAEHARRQQERRR